jgi:hypothetical protein
MKATVDFRLTRENPEGYPLHAVCEEPIDLRLRKESKKLDPETLRITMRSSCKRDVMSFLLWNVLFGNSVSECRLEFAKLLKILVNRRISV